jgi:hypothetical protein
VEEKSANGCAVIPDAGIDSQTVKSAENGPASIRLAYKKITGSAPRTRSLDGACVCFVTHPQHSDEGHFPSPTIQLSRVLRGEGRRLDVQGAALGTLLQRAN